MSSSSATPLPLAPACSSASISSSSSLSISTAAALSLNPYFSNVNVSFYADTENQEGKSSLKQEPVEAVTTKLPQSRGSDEVEKPAVCVWMCKNPVSVKPCTYCEGDNGESCGSCSNNKCDSMKRICVTCWLKDKTNKQCSRCEEKIQGDATVCELCGGRNGELSFLCTQCADIQCRTKNNRVWCKICSKFEEEESLVPFSRPRTRLSKRNCGDTQVSSSADTQVSSNADTQVSSSAFRMREWSSTTNETHDGSDSSRKKKNVASETSRVRKRRGVSRIGDHEDVDRDEASLDETGELSMKSLTWHEAEIRARNLSAKAKKVCERQAKHLVVASMGELESLRSHGMDFIWHHFGPHRAREPKSTLRHYFVQAKNSQRSWVPSGWLEKYYTTLVEKYWAGSGIFKPTLWISDPCTKYVFIFAVNGNGRGTGDFKGYRVCAQMYDWNHPRIKEGFDKTFQEAQCQWYRETVNHTSPQIANIVSNMVREGCEGGEGFDVFFDRPIARSSLSQTVMSDTTQLHVLSQDQTQNGSFIADARCLSTTQIFQPPAEQNLVKLITTLQAGNEQTNRRFEIMQEQNEQRFAAMQANANLQMKELGLQLMQGFANALQSVKTDLSELVDRKITERLSSIGSPPL